MNLWQLQVFREVMLTGSLTKAAKNLGRTQPAISAAIANLERHVGYELFERKNSRLHPVPEAQFLLSEAEGILGRISSLERSMREGSGLGSAQVRVACMPILADFFMPRVIGQFTRQHPNTHFLMMAPSSFNIYERIAAQQFDVGLAELGWESDLVHVDKFEVNCVCALSSKDPLASRPFVTPGDLDGRPCATLLPEHVIPRRLRQIYEEAGARLNVQFELQNAASQYPLIAENIAYGIFSPLSAWIYRTTHQRPQEIRFLPLRPSVVYPFAVLTPMHRPMSRLSREFIALLLGEVRKLILEMDSVFNAGPVTDYRTAISIAKT